MNMSYCRFENTERALSDCLEALQECGGVENYIEDNNPSEYELQAIRDIMVVAKELLEYEV